MRKLVATLTARTPVLSHDIIPTCSRRLQLLPTDSRGMVVKLTGRGRP
jgi:hypothetical protein